LKDSTSEDCSETLLINTLINNKNRNASNKRLGCLIFRRGRLKEGGVYLTFVVSYDSFLSVK